MKKEDLPERMFSGQKVYVPVLERWATLTGDVYRADESVSLRWFSSGGLVQHATLFIDEIELSVPDLHGNAKIAVDAATAVLMNDHTYAAYPDDARRVAFAMLNAASCAFQGLPLINAETKGSA